MSVLIRNNTFVTTITYLKHLHFIFNHKQIMFLIMVHRAKHVGNYVSAGYSMYILWLYVTEHNFIKSTQYTTNTFKFMNVSIVGKQIMIEILCNEIFIKLTFTTFEWSTPLLSKMHIQTQCCKTELHDCMHAFYHNKWPYNK